MNGRHTPAPWRLERGPDGSFEVEADGRGVGGGMLVIAARREHPRMVDEMHANGRLIAAAPELLAALRHIADAEPSALALDYCRGIARAVIRKATGEGA